jgi:hypothetical protein
MTASMQGIARIYGILLRLFPRDFKNEFREEMEEVFSASLEEAAKTGTTLVIRACFFELLDLPGNLVIEHLSNLRKGNAMKTKSFEVGRSRAALMAAVGMSVGWVLNNLLGEYLSSHGVYQLPFTLVGTILFTIPIILCGLMLGIAVGVGRRAFLRIVLWTVAGGILGNLVSLPIRMVNQRILSTISAYPGSWKYNSTFILCLVGVMCAYGLFYGAGLGLAFGSWKASIKFALIGLVANAVGLLAGYFIASSVKGISDPSYITWSIMGALAGGILGWFFGKARQPEADPVMGAGTA